MGLPGFHAEASAGPTIQTYRVQNLHHHAANFLVPQQLGAGADPDEISAGDDVDEEDIELEASLDDAADEEEFEDSSVAADA